ncbi:uncharacterized protein LOC108916538 [Anoplophora glabripennis]|uniref:uncharacterized protein LOC108916538 n=1 Tax=Anoplophora glabripennis TaxID=217634 RepID=UPI0008742739|nr:uncharacterized protein LOC108916538 [Anoplophora glabripennis]
MNLFRIKRILYNPVTNLRNLSVSIKRPTKPNAENINPEEPVKYSASPASKYKAKYSITGNTEPRLWYEPHVLLTSMTIFLIYFTLLREENDIDQELNTSLYSRIAGLEEHQLTLSLQYNQQNGLDTDAILNRLKEIKREKNENGIK